jgi:hypothetical protein
MAIGCPKAPSLSSDKERQNDFGETVSHLADDLPARHAIRDRSCPFCRAGVLKD